MLSRLRNEAWASDNLDILYLDDDALAWAKKTGDHESEATFDFINSNGADYLKGYSYWFNIGCQVLLISQIRDCSKKYSTCT